MVSMLNAIVLSAFFLCSALTGQGWSWQLSTTPFGSTSFPVMASSAQHRLTLLISNDVGTYWNGATKNGQIFIPRRLNEGGTLVFDESRGQWLHFEFGRTRLIDGSGKVTELQISGTQRTGQGPAVYDPVRREIIGSAFGYTFTLKGTTWKEERIGPGGYSGDSGMCFLPKTQTVLWHGGTLSSSTWEWNGQAWRQLSTKLSPPPRRNGWLVYDPTTGLVWRGGGYDQVANLRDLWSFDGQDWTQVSVSCPFQGHIYLIAAAFDHAMQQVISLDNRGRVWRLVQGHPSNIEAFELGPTTRCQGTTRLEAVGNSRPRLGVFFNTHTYPVPSNSASVFMIGAERPLHGGAFGLRGSGVPECHVYFIPTHYAAVGEQGGFSTYSLPIPNDPGLLCNYFYLQAIVVNLNANALGLVTSNGLMCHIGR